MKREKECLHYYIFDYSTYTGDWYVCIHCGHKELRSVK